MGGKSKKYAIGLGRFTGYKSGMPYCSEARAIFRYMTDEPNSTRKAALNRMVYGMIGDNLWVDDNDRLWMFAAHSGSGNTSLMDILHPGIRGNDCTNVNSTTFGIDEGYTGNGIDMYLNTNYNPNTDGINYALNSASFGFYCRTNSLVNGRYDMGARDVGGWSLLGVGANGGIGPIFRVNDLTGDVVVNANAQGCWVVSRTAVNQKLCYLNSTPIINVASLSTAIPSHEFYILAYNNVGAAAGFVINQIAAAFAGGGMAQTKVNNLTDWINGYMTEIGKNVF